MTFDKNDVNIREIYRYLGYRGIEPDEKIDKIVKEVVTKLFERIQPRNIYRIYDCRVYGDKVELSIENDIKYTIHSSDLSENLNGCEKCLIFAATLGIEADKLLQKYEIVNMTYASVLQACAAATIEGYCNKLQADIKVNAEAEGYYIRPRFSPGYGDLSLENQKDIFRELDCYKRLGLTLTDSLLMYPTKSVTAYIGFTTNKENCHVEKCKDCKNKGCEFRDENY